MILIAPFAKALRNGQKNAKDYPFWKELIELIEEPIVQIGLEGEAQLVPDFRKNLKLSEVKALLKECRTWVSVDSFLQHMAQHVGKPGIVIWSVSDPKIFGYPENINLLKSRDYLRDNQFAFWEDCIHNPDAFMAPEEVAKYIKYGANQISQ